MNKCLKNVLAVTAALTVLAAGTVFANAEEIGPGYENTQEEITSETNEEHVVTVHPIDLTDVPKELRDSDEYKDEDMTFNGTFEAGRFELPEGAKVLVVVEGTGGSTCHVYTYEYTEPESDPEETASEGRWELVFDTDGFIGLNGMSNNRTEGDKTTPIGVFQLNTPFGQDAPSEGFPEDYIQVDETYVWSDASNRLEKGYTGSGEQVGTPAYSEYYDYAIDCGYNINAIAGKGSALFIHCNGHNRTDTAGCVSIPKEYMYELMMLYGRYGDGTCYIGIAPEGTFDLIYDTYGVNNGLSPDGDFGV